MRHKILKTSILLGSIGFILVITLMRFSFFGSHEKNLMVNGVKRSYYLHLPKGYDSSKKYPLVLFFHGYNNSPKIAEWYSGMSKKADQEGFIVVYPKGTGYGPGLYLSWNAGFCCDVASEKNVDDVGFTKVLIESLEKKYSIDSKRVYATGHSNGALFVHRLGLELPDTFAAIAPVSGSIGGMTSPEHGSTMNKIMKHPQLSFVNNPTFKPVPILIIHGKKDTVIPYDGGVVKGNTFDSVKQTVSFWLKNNGCGDIKPTVESKNGVEKSVYSCKNGEVMQITYPDATHAWMGGAYDRIKNGPKPYEKATDIVWNFLKTHSKSDNKN